MVTVFGDMHGIVDRAEVSFAQYTVNDKTFEGENFCNLFYSLIM